MRYRNRVEAGEQLAAALSEVEFGSSGMRPVVLGVARGGVVVAAPVAAAFDAPLGAVIARKLGAPRNPELAIGAVAADGEPYVDIGLARRLGVSAEYVEQEVVTQREAIAARIVRYGQAAALEVAGRDVVVIDDGVATGATLIAALRSVRARAPGRLICAVPVGPPDTVTRLSNEADLVVCPERPAAFAAVGQWYRDFTQTSDEEVTQLLNAAK
jgi:predicted phosphoribosyltransferase